jgi:type III secretion HrpO family protein
MDEWLMNVAQQGLWLVLLISAPAVGASLAVGIVTGILQAVTQVQDASLGFAPKLAVVGTVLAFSSPWIGAQLIEFTTVLLQGLPALAQ